MGEGYKHKGDKANLGVDIPNVLGHENKDYNLGDITIEDNRVLKGTIDLSPTCGKESDLEKKVKRNHGRRAVLIGLGITLITGLAGMGLFSLALGGVTGSCYLCSSIEDSEEEEYKRSGKIPLSVYEDFD
ncbi:MAG: hypothetical protein GOU97_02095 [Nanoarchaeota archaeon]|nr:hypothetical protein [Nanoarchaeota archaeon]